MFYCNGVQLLCSCSVGWQPPEWVDISLLWKWEKFRRKQNIGHSTIFFLKRQQPYATQRRVGVNSVPSFIAVKFWAAELTHESSRGTEERSKRVKAANIDNTIAQVHQIVLDKAELSKRDVRGQHVKGCVCRVQKVKIWAWESSPIQKNPRLTPLPNIPHSAVATLSRAGRSTETALYQLMKLIQASMDIKETAICAFLDIERAVERAVDIPHKVVKRTRGVNRTREVNE